MTAAFSSELLEGSQLASPLHRSPSRLTPQCLGVFRILLCSIRRVRSMELPRLLRAVKLPLTSKQDT